jgi:hypothetical protein
VSTITKTVQIRKPLTNEQKDNLLKEISDAQLIIDERNEALKAFRDTIKEIIEQQSDIIEMSLANYRAGSLPENVECSITYLDGKAKFVDIKTGEVVDEHEITEAEQLMLSENRVDAEDIIRQASKDDD